MLEVRVQVFRLYFELFMIGFPINLKTLITYYLKCVSSYLNQIKPNTETEVLNSLSLVNMFVEDLSEPLLNIRSNALQKIQEENKDLVYEDCSQEMTYLKEEQKKFINSQIAGFAKKFKEVQAIIATEKSRQEDELHEIYKKGAEMTPEKREKYEGICAKYESLGLTGTL